MNKKLIEVALPLEKINEQAAREKSIRHGHPSTLHLWWARRPLAAARAVIWSSLVDDPSSHPEQFPTEEAQNKERERLFGILERLVVWENSNNEQVLAEAKAEIMKSTGGDPPALLDPFAGGGAIPLEAQRLGLEAHAHDLNPVAVMINKAMIEIPPRFSGMSAVNPKDIDTKVKWKGAAGLAADVKYYGEWMKQEAFKRIGHLYPKVKDENGVERTVIAWIWARTVTSPNPMAHRAKVPLISSMMLSTKKNNTAWVEIVEDNNIEGRWHFEVKTGELSKDQLEKKALGTKAGKAKDFMCCITNTPIKREYIQAEGKAGHLSKRLMAIVTLDKKGRKFISPTSEHERIALSIEDNPELETVRNTFLSGATPTRAMVTGGVCSAYGLKSWGSLFTGRQLTTLTTFCSLIDSVQKKIINDGGTEEYSNSICTYLAFAIDKLVDINSSACSWISANGVIRNTFARQAIPMVWDFTEANPFSNSSGSYNLIIEKVTECITEFPAKNNGKAKQIDAQIDSGFNNIMISTDPPYYDNIAYAILSDFFYVWLRQSLRTYYPELFNTMLTPKSDELVVSPYRFEGGLKEAKDFFETGMLNVFKRIHDYSRNDIPVTVYYAYKQNESNSDGVASTGWETMLTAIIEAGFSITGTWPMRTERGGRMVGIGANALASSIVLVCRKRPEDAPSTTRRNFVTELKRELKPALQKMQTSNIAPVDLAQSAIGPGMGVFSKYKSVLEADGTAMTVRSALQIINQELDIYFNEQDGELDKESRFCVELYTQFAFNELKFGDADTLARAKNTSVEHLKNAGVVYAEKGVVRLLGRDEIAEKPYNEKIIWLLTQQLVRVFEKDGIKGCVRAVSELFDNKAEAAKNLAYRLFTIAERKGWAAEAYAYNNLVTAWQDIRETANGMAKYPMDGDELTMDDFMYGGMKNGT